MGAGEFVEARLSAITPVALEEAKKVPQALITRIHTNKNKIFPFFVVWGLWGKKCQQNLGHLQFEEGVSTAQQKYMSF